MEKEIYDGWGKEKEKMGKGRKKERNGWRCGGRGAKRNGMFAEGVWLDWLAPGAKAKRRNVTGAPGLFPRLVWACTEYVLENRARVLVAARRGPDDRAAGDCRSFHPFLCRSWSSSHRRSYAWAKVARQAPAHCPMRCADSAQLLACPGQLRSSSCRTHVVVVSEMCGVEFDGRNAKDLSLNR